MASPPGTSFFVPYEVPFRLFAHESQICFLPIFKGRGLTHTWLVEVHNRVGDVHAALFAPVGGQAVGTFPLNVSTWKGLASFERDCKFGAGIRSISL